jgi:PAS domain S-box-containing protein
MKPEAGSQRDHDGEDKPAVSLRRLAEKRMGATAGSRPLPVTTEEMQKLIHELQVHRIELEIQNEELVRARDEVEAGLERYTELYDFAPVGYFTLDKAGTIRQVNLTGAAMLGRERSLVVGRKFQDFISPCSHNVCNTFLQTVCAGPERKIREGELALNGDPPVYVHINAHLPGTGDGCIIAVTDITARKQAEMALQVTNRKLNTLAGITRHDINNQLLSLLGFLGLLKKKITDPELGSFIDRAETAAQTIRHQIEFTKMYENIGVQAPRWQDVRTCLNALRSTLPLGETEIVISLDALQVYADLMLEKVFYNLLDNSLRHGGETMTAIRISLQETDRGMVIIYADNGAGISTENKKRLFERGSGNHTGLGLFLSREILSITGITIAETGESGNGARFEIHVPKGVYRYADR